VIVGSDAVGLVGFGGPGLDSMSPARIRRAASHYGRSPWLADRKNGSVLLPTKGLVGGGLRE